MTLHHPFRAIDNLLGQDDERFGTWMDAYAVCRSTHYHPESDGLPREIQLPDDEFEEASFDGDVDDDPNTGGWGFSGTVALPWFRFLPSFYYRNTVI